MIYYIWREGYNPCDASEEVADYIDDAARKFAEFMTHTTPSKSKHVLHVTDAELRSPVVYDVETTVSVDVKVTRRVKP